MLNSLFFKYRRHLTIGYQTRMEHRFSVLCSIAVFMFPLVAQIVFWKAVYRSGSGMIAGFDLTDMVTYLLIHQFVFELTWCEPGVYHVRPDIVRGGLTPHLLLPAKYLYTVFFRWTGDMFPRVTSTATIFAFLIVLFWDHFKIDLNAWVFGGFIFATVFCYIVKYLFNFLIGMAAFWTESDVPLVKRVSWLLAGGLVPLAFLPHGLQTIADYLPFKYTLYFPTMLLLGKVSPSDFGEGIFIQAAWILVLFGIIHVVWRRGIRRYEAYGG